jgi:hypothetical protein
MAMSYILLLYLSIRILTRQGAPQDHLPPRELLDLDDRGVVQFPVLSKVSKDDGKVEVGIEIAVSLVPLLEHAPISLSLLTE